MVILKAECGFKPEPETKQGSSTRNSHQRNLAYNLNLRTMLDYDNSITKYPVKFVEESKEANRIKCTSSMVLMHPDDLAYIYKVLSELEDGSLLMEESEKLEEIFKNYTP